MVGYLCCYWFTVSLWFFETQTLLMCLVPDFFRQPVAKLFIKWTQGPSDLVQAISHLWCFCQEDHIGIDT